MMLTRSNSHGLTYCLFGQVDNSTKIVHKGKSITVAHHIDKMNMAWFQWTMGGKFIQEAFDFLTRDEREFLKTGITPAEWQEIFAERPS
ncbi:hypothetical protein EHM76_04430 [bacterium]|nr:MAG: hypothetical protein EHM76_04430 [bacterium]